MIEGKAVQTPFVCKSGIRSVSITFTKEDELPGIPFVLHNTKTGEWIKDHGQNFFVPLAIFSRDNPFPQAPELFELANEIVDAETGHNSWTLMHRFNLCYTLLERAKQSRDGLALLFVWLRFSFIRQLDWQRNYNTQPRELSHAQHRLTLKFAECYRDLPQSRDIIRLLFSTMGPGGEGQRIRDEILHIMHRHKIKEVSGHFMEEWHQKLHNNTTPDDIAICSAYLAFLRSNGDTHLFYSTLEEAGVTMERLENFDRPIVTQPDFVPHIKDGLIHDFEHFLTLLNSVHSGSDLKTAIHEARNLVEPELNDLLSFIWDHRDDRDMPVPDRIRAVTDARKKIFHCLHHQGDANTIRHLVYLDIALEEFSRIVLEGNIGSHLSMNDLELLTGTIIENILLIHDEPELRFCYAHWERLLNVSRTDTGWALHAKSILNRLRRMVASYTDRFCADFQWKAEFLGKGFQADTWTISLFSEEVIRGDVAFILSLLIRHLDPLLRKLADLGDWQVVSPGEGHGRVEVVESFRSLSEKQCSTSSIVIVDQVSGDEDVPPGVSAVITPKSVDLMSHLAVRVRNAGILFVTCYSETILETLKSLAGKNIDCKLNGSGDLVYEKSKEKTKTVKVPKKIKQKKGRKVSFTSTIVGMKEFTRDIVGAKSNNLVFLKDKIPDWITIPDSIAIPFGVFEQVLEDDCNKGSAKGFGDLRGQVERGSIDRLKEMRQLVMALNPPDNLFSTVRGKIESSGMGSYKGKKMEPVWNAIKQVWASLWNERAYISRKLMGVSSDTLSMAVLIQKVVEADYAFVLHTENPLKVKNNELYGEIVPGLGETLVDNCAGRAMGFVAGKKSKQLSVMSYPEKSFGLYGGGLIFRSDSNAEDLEGYSGAGLYDSVLLEEPEKRLLDYSQEKIVWDKHFSEKLMKSLTDIGLLLEDAFGFPQDVEGGYAQGNYYVVQSRPQVGV